MILSASVTRPSRPRQTIVTARLTPAVGIIIQIVASVHSGWLVNHATDLPAHSSYQRPSTLTNSRPARAQAGQSHPTE